MLLLLSATAPLTTGARVLQVERILPLARHYVRCSWYAEMRSRYEAGLVANAFAAACRLLLREYTLLIAQVRAAAVWPRRATLSLTCGPLLHAQLESFAREGRLSLQKLWFFLQPSLRTLATLDDVIFSAPFAMGTALRVPAHGCCAATHRRHVCGWVQVARC